MLARSAAAVQVPFLPPQGGAAVPGEPSCTRLGPSSWSPLALAGSSPGMPVPVGRAAEAHWQARRLQLEVTLACRLLARSLYTTSTSSLIELQVITISRCRMSYDWRTSLLLPCVRTPQIRQHFQACGGNWRQRVGDTLSLLGYHRRFVYGH